MFGPEIFFPLPSPTFFLVTLGQIYILKMLVMVVQIDPKGEVKKKPHDFLALGLERVLGTVQEYEEGEAGGRTAGKLFFLLRHQKGHRIREQRKVGWLVGWLDAASSSPSSSIKL